jgi:hypothetical protein
MDAIRFGSIFNHTKSKKIDGDNDRFIDEEPFIDKRKPSSTMVAKGVLKNGEHTLIFLWGGKTCCALIATPNVDNANRRQKKGKS